jgi:O-succinylbenzoic acid--CoA ligase
VLTITGRADDVIISGGVKVSLAAVELAVRGVPGLEDAVVVGAPHPQWGEAPVVVTTAQVPLVALREATAGLGDAAAPARVVVVASIPMLATGKPDRIAAAKLARD